MSGRTGASDSDVVLAERLLAEWDEGRGASKSEIERRVWGDGGAHGRHFDRFIRQTLGVATSKPSKQADRVRQLESRVRELESQLRRLGAAPRGAVLEDWEAQLQHARNAALAALRAWNDPTASFRTQNFALLFVAAWNSVAIAVLQRAGVEWRELGADGKPKLVDGKERARETLELVTEALPGEANLGLRRNIEFWARLRNQVAHRHLPALDAVVIPQAQAGLLNLENVLGQHFGEDFLLAEHLSVPLQLSGFRDPGVLASVKKLQASLPLDVQAYLNEVAQLNKDLADDPSYMLRVTLLPVVPSSGRSPDAIAYFVRPGEVPEELKEVLDRYVVLPKVVRPARPDLIAKQVVAMVSARIGYRFTMRMHTEASRRLGARPPQGQEDQAATDPRYCEYVTPVNRYLYHQAWVDRLVSELSTPEGFRATTGTDPQPKP